MINKADYARKAPLTAAGSSSTSTSTTTSSVSSSSTLMQTRARQRHAQKTAATASRRKTTSTSTSSSLVCPSPTSATSPSEGADSACDLLPPAGLTASLVSDLGFLSLSSTSPPPPSKLRRRNALSSEAEFQAAFSSQRDRWMSLRSASAATSSAAFHVNKASGYGDDGAISLGKLRGDLQLLSLATDEDTDDGSSRRTRKLPAQRSSSALCSPGTSSSSAAPPAPSCRPTRRPSRRPRLPPQKGEDGSSSSSNPQLSSITLHQDLLSYHPPDVLPANILRKMSESAMVSPSSVPQEAKKERQHPVVLYRPPASFVAFGGEDKRSTTVGADAREDKAKALPTF